MGYPFETVHLRERMMERPGAYLGNSFNLRELAA
jgi:hypothetical protein